MNSRTDDIREKLDDTKELVQERHSIVTYLSWGLLAVTAAFSLYTQNWDTVFLSIVVFVLTLIPFLFQSFSNFCLPRGLVGGIVFFMVATILLGEAGNFYERFWWWDAALHTFSAIGISIMGMLIVLFLIRGDRIRTHPAFMLVLMAFSFAVSIGTIWEIFEFGMDQIMGTNMQKSGLVDTMYDLIVDVVGSAIGASAGYIYLRAKGHGNGILSNTIEEAVKQNPDHFN